MNEEKFQALYKNTKKEEIIKELYYKCNANNKLVNDNERLNNIINKALEKTKGLQYRFGYVLDDLIYILMQGVDKEC